jgi:histidinol-phosphate aminotransferase
VAFAEAVQAEGVSVRPFPGEGARVTIGEREANDLFLTIACAWRQ